VVPVTSRPLLDLELIGREKDVEWLKTTSGAEDDRLLIGQPGSGKTYLLHRLARDGWGLFLIHDDPTEIANALRDQQPEVVIVDDAHADPSRLERLIQLRREIGQDFAIVATAWEGDRDPVAEALGVPESKIRKLELLTRAQILEVFKQAGVKAPDDYLRDLVTQASNKPGLAVTLAVLWLRGDWRSVLQGEAIRRSLLTFFDGLVGKEASDLLGVLSLGGEHGMSLEVAGDFLDLGRQQARRLAIGLAAGGVLAERRNFDGRDRILSVQPSALRSALLRHCFFDSLPFDYRELLDKVPSLPSAVMAILEAAARGTRVPDVELRALVARTRATDAWEAYAYLGEDEARWVLEHYPGDFLDLAKATLREAPRFAIPKLLARAVSATGPLHSQPFHPLRLLEDWIKELKVSPEEALTRRQLTVRLAKRHLDAGGDLEVGIRAVLLALTPERESMTPSPAASGVTIRWSLLPLEQLRAMEKVWEEAREVIIDITAEIWPHFQKALWPWIYPKYGAKGEEVDEKAAHAMHYFARRVLQDLAPLAQGSPGFAAGLKRLAKRIDLELPAESDTVFELFYPADDYRDREELERRQAEGLAAVQELAERWALQRSPREVAEELKAHEQEAARIGHRGWPPRTENLCRSLASLTEHPQEWLAAFVEGKLRGELVAPFLRRVIETQPDGWEKAIRICFKSESQAWAAASQILELPEPPPQLLEQALEITPNFPRSVQTMCLREQIPLGNLRALLRHPDWKVALAAAVGEWTAGTKGQIREELTEDWREAILRSPLGVDGESLRWARNLFWSQKILASDPELALSWIRRWFEWHRNRFESGDKSCHRDASEPFEQAVDALDKEQRIQLLEELEDAPLLGDLLRRLVNGDPDLYRRLLERKDLRVHHLAPLEKDPDPAWLDMAILAVRAGRQPQDIATTVLFSKGSFSPLECGSRLDQYFAELESHTEADIREVARYGREIAQKYLEEAKKRQRQSELHGL